MGYPQWALDRADAAQSGFDAGFWDIRMDGTALSVAALAGRTIIPKHLRGPSAVRCAIVGGLSVPKRLAGRAGSAATGEGHLAGPKRMEGHVMTAIALTGALVVPKTLGGVATGRVSAMGCLSVPKRLFATAKSRGSVAGALAVPKRLSGRAGMVDRATATLGSALWSKDVEGYARLITSEHATRPRFMATVRTLTARMVEAQECLRSLSTAFDVDTAVGMQLDQVGLWVGVGRVLRMGLTGVYFSLDEAGVGFDEGVWKGPFDPDTGLVTLPDDQYRTLIYARIAANRWDGTIPGAYDVWHTVFPGSFVFIQDWQNMSMTVGIAGLALNAVLRRLLIDGYIPLKPEGVRVDYYAIGTETGPLFGLDTDNEALAGFDTGQWAVELKPLL